MTDLRDGECWGNILEIAAAGCIGAAMGRRVAGFVDGSPDQFAAHIRAECGKYAKVVKLSGTRVD
jgi:hypothetical protein